MEPRLNGPAGDKAETRVSNRVKVKARTGGADRAQTATPDMDTVVAAPGMTRTSVMDADLDPVVMDRPHRPPAMVLVQMRPMVGARLQAIDPSLDRSAKP